MRKRFLVLVFLVVVGAGASCSSDSSSPTLVDIQTTDESGALDTGDTLADLGQPGDTGGKDVAGDHTLTDLIPLEDGLDASLDLGTDAGVDTKPVDVADGVPGDAMDIGDTQQPGDTLEDQSPEDLVDAEDLAGPDLHVCTPGEPTECYTGPEGSLDVGVCQAGTAYCLESGMEWSPCEGEIVPTQEDCNTADDESCNGVAFEEGGIDCVCEPELTLGCYMGPPGTEGVGTCVSGLMTCNSLGTGWSPCLDEVTPIMDVCGDLLDNDCNGVEDDGVLGGAEGCVCYPASVQPCYTGPLGTEEIGLCLGGTEACRADGTGFGTCESEVLPHNEICANNIDEDCDGIVDNVADLDGDGFTACEGDCCETGSQCAEPKGANPGAFDYAGDGVDNDCDGVVDNAPSICDGGLTSNTSAGLDYAKAMELCQTTTENPPKPQRKWGVLSAELLKADGTPLSAAAAAPLHSVRDGFGVANPPQKGTSLVVLSTGSAADKTDTNPAWNPFTGLSTGTNSPGPIDWLAAHGNLFPSLPGCPGAAATTAYDPIMLRIRIRVPTNAASFSVRANYFTADYPEYLCSQYSDFFVVLLDSSYSGSSSNPPDKNVASFPLTGGMITNNYGYVSPGFYQACMNDNMGCATGVAQKLNTCSAGTNGLLGTGFDSPRDGCGSSTIEGAGTGWLTISGNVVPGEVIALRFAIWDVGDALFDALVLLDSFQWSQSPATPGITQ